MQLYINSYCIVGTVLSGCSGCSVIVVYGGEDIVFGAKRSDQWM